VLFGSGRGNFSRVAKAYLPRLRSVPVSEHDAQFIGDRANAPRNFAIGEFVAAGRTEIAAGTAEGDVVILAYERGRLQEVARTQTELVLPDVHVGAFRQPGRAGDLFVTWNLSYPVDRPRPRLFYSDPSFAAGTATPSGGRSRAVHPAAQTLSFSVKTSGDCAPADAVAMTLTRDGIFGLYRSAGLTLETAADDQGTMHFRIDAPWLTSSVTAALTAVPGGYEAWSVPAWTVCGQQRMNVFAEAK